jgi:lipopolysaccharide/colanic/teichoic acid biosynthesis glycosyltransferase
VLKGEMSIVGPRPEVRKYVDMYTEEQLKALKVLPGITDYASIQYRNENDLLALSNNPEELYVKEIMPKKIEINFRYINNRSIGEYFKIIAQTVITSLKGK